jgi:hypothetical protein
MLAPGDAAVLAHILRTDPHLHPPRHPDRLTTNTYLGPARWENAWSEFVPFLDYGGCRRITA